MKGRRALAAPLLLATSILLSGLSACSDRNAELEAELRTASSAMADHRVAHSKRVVLGREDWVLVAKELRYLAKPSYVGDTAPAANPTAPPEHADPIPAIVDFHRQLAERDIDLYVVPIPLRPSIYPEAVLGSEPFAKRQAIPDLDSHLRELVSGLREQGVRVIDLAPTFLAARQKPEHGPLFLHAETHWTPYSISLAARALADEIEDQPWYVGIPKLEISQRWVEEMWIGGTNRALEQATGVAQDPGPVQVRKVVLRADSGPQLVEMSHPDSPVLVIGDSNAFWWDEFQSALPHQLTFELGFPVDTLPTKGGGANKARLNLVRRVRSDPTYLDSKRVIVWCFSARTFTITRNGWIPIPF